MRLSLFRVVRCPALAFTLIATISAVSDVPGRRVARTIDLEAFRRPHGIAFLPGDRLVVVTSEASRHVVVVDVVAGEVHSAIPTQHGGSHMVGVVADGSRAYTGDMGSNTVSELNITTGQYVRSFNVPTEPEAVNCCRIFDATSCASSSAQVTASSRASRSPAAGRRGSPPRPMAATRSSR